MRNTRYSRRSILRTGVQAVAGAGLVRVPGLAGTGGNRILVGVYLLGGNDGNNMVVPLDNYADYARSRGALAIPQADLLASEGDGTANIGFHPALREVRDLFDSETLAVVANVGADVPANQHDNPDFAYFVPGYVAPLWAVTAAGSASLKPNGNVVTGFGSTALTLTGRGAEASQAGLRTAAADDSIQFSVAFPQSGIGRQLQQAARIINAGLGGMMNPHFFAVQSGYDTHADQLRLQANQLAELSAALGAFQSAMLQMGLSRQVTLYTDSEFGRTLAPNAAGGTEHGWGNHQLVMGGSVMGGKVHGDFPSLVAGGASDAGRTGVWKPTASKASYLAGLARWAGINATEFGGTRALQFLN